jgi:FkbM family methyltransferase
MTSNRRERIFRDRVYRWFRCSRLYPWYAWIFRPSFAQFAAADRAFFQALFTAHQVRFVYDVGANVGDKAEVFRRLAGRVVCVEADPDTADFLRYRFRGRPGVVVEPSAVGDQIGRAELSRKPHFGFNTLSAKWSDVMSGRGLPTSEIVTVPVTTLDQLVLRHGPPDYIKIDVEGYELPVVRGLTSPVPVLSVEANLPAFRPETDQVIDRILALDPNTRFNAWVGDSPGWVLPGPADAPGIRRAMDDLGAGTCEVFALRPRAS